MDMSNSAPGIDEKETLKRRSPWATSWDAIQHLIVSMSDEGSKVRKSDNTTSILLVLVVLSFSGFIIFPQGREILFGADLIFAAIAIYYVANRLGILCSLDARKTVVVGELLLGLVVLTVLAVMNVSLLREFAVNMLKL